MEDETMTITFRFTLNAKVLTPLGEEGIITMLGFDNGGAMYWVVTKNNSQWFIDALLKPIS